MLEFIFTGIFWLSFSFVGLLLLKKIEKHMSSRAIDGDVIVRFFLGTILGFVAFLPFITIGYIFKLEVATVSFLWLFTALYSAFKLIANFKTKKIPYDYFKKRPLMFLLLCVITVDYLVSYLIGGFTNLGTDVWVHLSRINDLFENGFSLRDPYFPTLIDPRYHLSVLHPIYSVGMYLLRIDSVTIWSASLAFFRAMAAISVYSAIKLVTAKKEIAALSSMASLIVLSYDWRFVLYPNKAVTIFAVALIILVARSLDKNTPRALKLAVIGSSMLIALTHAPFSIGVAGVMCLIAVLDWALSNRKNTLKSYWHMIVSVVFLLLPPLFSSLIPVRRELVERTAATLNVVGVEILHPGSALFLTAKSGALFIAATVLLLWVLLKRRPSFGLRSATLGSGAFYFLIAFTPLFSILDEYLPSILIRRFRETNIFTYSILGLAPVILATYYLSRTIKKLRILSIPIALTATILIMVANIDNAKKFAGSQIDFNNETQEVLLSLNSLGIKAKFQEKNLVVAPEGVSYILPAISNSAVVGVYKSHSSPSSDYNMRKKCYEELVSTDRLTRQRALNTLKPAYYLSDPKTEHILNFPELEEVSRSNKGNRDYILYEVMYKEVENLGIASNACSAIQQGQA